MEMEQDEKWRKTFFCSEKTQAVLVSTPRWCREQSNRRGRQLGKKGGGSMLMLMFHFSLAVSNSWMLRSA